MRVRTSLLLLLGSSPVAYWYVANAATDVVDEGCPQTSDPVEQDDEVLQTFVVPGGGVVWGEDSAALELKLEGGLFKSQSFSTSSSVVFVCAADFDGDGWEDFIGANDQNDGEIALYKNKSIDNLGTPDWSNPNYVVAPKFERTYGFIEDN
jgi:hypothetical protein